MASESKLNIVITSEDKTDLDGIGGKLDKIGGTMQKTGGIMTAAFTAPLIGIGIASMNMASDVDESMSKVMTLFEDAGDEVIDWSDTTAEAMGIAKAESLEMSGELGNLLIAQGLGGEAAAGMSMEMVQLAADMASFNNASPEETFAAIQAGAIGSSEPLRKYGVVISAASTQQKAMEMTGKDTVEALTQQDLTMARLKLITEQTSMAQGDFAKTSGGLANQTRIAEASFKDAGAALGQQLLPIGIKVMGWVNEAVTWFKNLSDTQMKWIVIIGGIVAAIGPLLLIMGTLISTLSTIIPVIGAVAGILSGPLLLAIGAIIAIAALLVTAWKKDWGGIRTTLTNIWNNKIKPIFEVLKAWLGVTIPAVIQILTDYWTNTLLPAINAVWAFIQDNVIPIFVLLQDLLEVAMVAASLALQVVWENVLKPALEAVWAFIQDNVLPILKTLAEWLEGPLAVAGDIATVLFDAFKVALSGVSDAVQWVIDKVKILIDWLAKLLIPAAVAPGSASPFEKSLLGIGKAMDSLSNKSLPKLTSELELTPSVRGGIAASSLGAGGLGAGGVTNTYYITAQYKQQDEKTLMNEIKMLQQLGRYA